MTKMMTCYLVFLLIDEHDIRMDTIITVTGSGSRLIGTSAKLQEGDKLTLNDLMYGMMLPSGNDAAWTLAEFFGAILRGQED